MTIKEKILFVLILFFLFTLFIPWSLWVNVIAALVLCFYSFFFNSWKEKWQLFKERKYILWMLLFFMMIGISVLLSSNLNRGLRYLDPRLPLLYFPVAIGLLQLRKEFKEKVLLGVAVLTTIIALFCLGYGIYKSSFFKKPELLYNDSLTLILGQQSIYISLLVNISIYIFTYHIIFKSPRYKGWLVLATLFLFAISYLLASRNLMLVLYAFIIGVGFYYIIRKKKYLLGTSLILGLPLCVFLIFQFFPKTFNRYKELMYTQFNYQSMGKESHYNMEVTKDQWNGANFRIAAWRCGWELFLSNPIKGVDIGDKKDALMEKYKEKNFQFGLQTQRNVHNNYLDILYSMGIVGFAFFLMGWVIYPLLYARQYKDWLSILIILTFMIAWVTEIYFDRSLGGMLTGFFIPFLLISNKE